MYTFLESDEVFETKDEAISKAKIYFENKNDVIENRIRGILKKANTELYCNNKGKFLINDELDINNITIANLELIKKLIIEKEDNLRKIELSVKKVTQI